MDIEVTIGRTNGPVTDRKAHITFTSEELEIVKDTLAAVNAVSEKEQWYVQVGKQIIIPLHD